MQHYLKQASLAVQSKATDIYDNQKGRLHLLKINGVSTEYYSQQKLNKKEIYGLLNSNYGTHTTSFWHWCNQNNIKESPQAMLDYKEAVKWSQVGLQVVNKLRGVEDV